MTEKPESVLYAVCPKCHRPIQLDISSMLKTITTAFTFNDKTLAKEIKECLTNGWSEHEKTHWKDYLEEEIKPYWPSLYDFLMENKEMGYIYVDSEGRKASLEEAMASSQVYVGFVTHNFIEDVRNGDIRILKEIEAAKNFKKHCILLFFDNLTEDDKKFAEKLFHEHMILKKYENVPCEQFRNWCETHMAEIKQLIGE